MKFAFAAALLAISLPLAANNEIAAPLAEVDYPGFVSLTGEVADYRQQRLVSLADFKARATKEGALILDTRSAAAFAMGHMDGAVNLPFSDFTDEKLRQIIGDNPDREILIYCNNNLYDNIPPVVLKRAPLALNIPTFINLYGYGYKNIYELQGSYSLKDPEIGWVAAEQSKPL